MHHRYIFRIYHTPIFIPELQKTVDHIGVEGECKSIDPADQQLDTDGQPIYYSSNYGYSKSGYIATFNNGSSIFIPIHSVIAVMMCDSPIIPPEKDRNFYPRKHLNL